MKLREWPEKPPVFRSEEERAAYVEDIRNLVKWIPHDVAMALLEEIVAENAELLGYLKNH